MNNKFTNIAFNLCYYKDVNNEKKYIKLQIYEYMNLVSLIEKSSNSLKRKILSLYDYNSLKKILDPKQIKNNSLIISYDISNPDLSEIKEIIKEKIIEYKIRVSVLGLPRIGKSAMVLRFINKNFFEDYETTIESEYDTKFLTNNKIFKLSILDTAGQEEFIAAKPKWFFKRDAFILALSIENPNLNYIKKLYEEDIKEFYNNTFEENNFNNIIIIIALTKCDLNIPNKHQIMEEVKNFAKINNFLFFKTSSKLDIGINEIFEEICNIVSKAKNEFSKNDISTNSNSILTLHKDYENESSFKICISNFFSSIINFCCDKDFNNFYEEEYKIEHKLTESCEEINYNNI